MGSIKLIKRTTRPGLGDFYDYMYDNTYIIKIIKAENVVSVNIKPTDPWIWPEVIWGGPREPDYITFSNNNVLPYEKMEEYIKNLRKSKEMIEYVKDHFEELINPD